MYSLYVGDKWWNLQRWFCFSGRPQRGGGAWGRSSSVQPSPVWSGLGRSNPVRSGHSSCTCVTAARNWTQWLKDTQIKTNLYLYRFLCASCSFQLECVWWVKSECRDAPAALLRFRAGLVLLVWYDYIPLGGCPAPVRTHQSPARFFILKVSF